MELTNKQEDKIVQKVIEQILNKMPEVIGNLMSQHATMNKIQKDFFKNNTHFKEHKEIVAQVVKETEGGDITLGYHEIMDKAIPEINRRIGLKEKLDVKVPEKKDLNLKVISDHGEI